MDKRKGRERVLTQITQAIRQRHTINPKTVLGFYATVLGLVFTGAVGAIAVLATTKVDTGVIPFLLAFCGLILLGLLVGVFVVTLKDPSKLMLTQVSGVDYLAIQQRTVLGDSRSGERVEAIDIDPVRNQALPTPVFGSGNLNLEANEASTNAIDGTVYNADDGGENVDE